jgi:hypothetical protein
MLASDRQHCDDCKAGTRCRGTHPDGNLCAPLSRPDGLVPPEAGGRLKASFEKRVVIVSVTLLAIVALGWECPGGRYDEATRIL